MSTFRTTAIAATAALFASQAFGATTLIISEVVDATLPGGLPKFVELTNTGSTTLDMADYGFGLFNDGSAILTSFNSLSGSLAAGDSFVISFELNDSIGSSAFLDTYGFDADFLNFGNEIDGNDAMVLYEGPGASILDVYGVVGVDGVGEAWEYTDGYAVRNSSVVMSNGGFTPSEWTFSGPNALETGDDTEELALILANTTPGTHDFGTAVVPLPAPVFLLGGGLLALGAMRRRR